MKQDYNKIFEEAITAGKKAANDCTPTPMVVGTPKDVFGKTIDPSKPIYLVKGGMCGFASVKGIDGRSGFGRWLIKNNSGKKSYSGGVYVNSPICSQSYEMNKAACGAMANVFQKFGISCWIDARLD